MRALSFTAVIDLHCHVLPGIDDGVQSFDASVALARAAALAGTRTLVATPHVSARYRNDAETIGRLAHELRRRLSVTGVELQVLAGAEIAWSQLGALGEDEISRLTLGGGPWLLVEPPFATAAIGLVPTLLELRRSGRSVLLAHPERCPAFHREPSLLRALLAEGILTSITAGSLVGSFGRTVRRFALELVHAGMVHNVASDAHDASQRPPSIRAELEKSGLDPLADWLTHEVPAAILAGEPIPSRPAVELPELAAPRPSWLGARPSRL